MSGDAATEERLIDLANRLETIEAYTAALRAETREFESDYVGTTHRTLAAILRRPKL